VHYRQCPVDAAPHHQPATSPRDVLGQRDRCVAEWLPERLGGSFPTLSNPSAGRGGRGHTRRSPRRPRWIRWLRPSRTHRSRRSRWSPSLGAERLVEPAVGSHSGRGAGSRRPILELWECGRSGAGEGRRGSLTPASGGPSPGGLRRGRGVRTRKARTRRAHSRRCQVNLRRRARRLGPYVIMRRREA
jgi:hypothetical protein